MSKNAAQKKLERAAQMKLGQERFLREKAQNGEVKVQVYLTEDVSGDIEAYRRLFGKTDRAEAILDLMAIFGHLDKTLMLREAGYFDEDRQVFLNKPYVRPKRVPEKKSRVSRITLADKERARNEQMADAQMRNLEKMRNLGRSKVQFYIPEEMKERLKGIKEFLGMYSIDAAISFLFKYVREQVRFVTVARDYELESTRKAVIEQVDRRDLKTMRLKKVPADNFDTLTYEELKDRKSKRGTRAALVS